ncbi:hypothetical protein AWH56_009025 [Anaerobacillus isosaccharinicus]|uniref:Uncharacterized protein n=1 Tax=Anaerobacillus isosaccharinicus TaxID=1532552 RepID=A0A1S2M8X6_9BACI|nr:hypothetical protein [Anaerobacillus isosaccharinicus]MBA5588894.1 hypothetical protein [Anaerobacillus isosaccharinicus]QOY37704.1 hypothetical protein AWH56_009025 [Anaerobacillus isosaccharinicus]
MIGLYGVAVYNEIEQENNFHTIFANHPIEAVILACENNEVDKKEMLQNYQDLGELLTYYADRNIYVTEPFFLSDLNEVVGKVLTAREIEVLYSLPTNTVGRDIQRGKLDNYKKEGFIRQSGSTWLIHEMVADKEYNLRPKAKINTILPRTLVTKADIETFLLNLDQYSQSIIETGEDKFHVFEFNELLDIGYSNHLILSHDIKGFYYEHASSKKDRDNRSAKSIPYDELIEIVYKNRASVSEVIKKAIL